MEPTRPKPPPDRPPKSPDDRKVPVGNNYTLLIIAVVACAAIAAFALSSRSPVVIKYGQLAQLIEKDKNPYLDVNELQNGKDLTVRYSNLGDLQIGPNEITGKVTREVLAPEDSARQPRRCRSVARATGWTRTAAGCSGVWGPTVLTTWTADRSPAPGRAISCSWR